MNYTNNGMVNTKFVRLTEWLEDMGVPTEHREQYAKDIIEDVEANATTWHNEYAKAQADIDTKQFALYNRSHQW